MNLNLIAGIPIPIKVVKCIAPSCHVMHAYHDHAGSFAVTLNIASVVISSVLLLRGYDVELMRDTTRSSVVYVFTAFQASTPFSPSLLLPIFNFPLSIF